jgi:hypothetical protein
LERDDARPINTALPAIARSELLALEVRAPCLANWDELVEVPR